MARWKRKTLTPVAALNDFCAALRGHGAWRAERSALGGVEVVLRCGTFRTGPEAEAAIESFRLAGTSFLAGVAEFYAERKAGACSEHGGSEHA
jgi:hypothetical protein